MNRYLLDKLKLSRHFRENWEARVGGQADPAVVRQVVAEGVRVQRGRPILTVDGQESRILSVYWHPGLDLVVSIDNVNLVAVSVLTPENMGGKSP